MTVAAVILAATADSATGEAAAEASAAQSAIADADGLPVVRRIADTAWAGGAVPIVVVASDAEGALARSLAGAPVTLAEPAPGGGSAAQLARGTDVAAAEIRETDAVLVWPVRFTWVGPETVTSLIEAHGTDRETILRPEFAGEPGWPVLVPLRLVARLTDIPPDRMLQDVVAALAESAPVRSIDLGDPGTVLDRSTPSAELPPYVGPTEPASGHVHEWGASVAELDESTPLDGPALAPYGQAVAEVPDQPG